MAELAAAKAMPKSTPAEKEIRRIAIENAKKQINAIKAVKKYFKDVKELTKPDFSSIEKLFDREDEINQELKKLYNDVRAQKKAGGAGVSSMKAEISKLTAEKKNVQKKIKDETNTHTFFSRAAKPFVDAEKLIKQAENYTHLGDIETNYEAAKMRLELAAGANNEA